MIVPCRLRPVANSLERRRRSRDTSQATTRRQQQDCARSRPRHPRPDCDRNGQAVREARSHFCRPDRSSSLRVESAHPCRRHRHSLRHGRCWGTRLARRIIRKASRLGQSIAEEGTPRVARDSIPGRGRGGDARPGAHRRIGSHLSRGSHSRSAQVGDRSPSRHHLSSRLQHRHGPHIEAQARLARYRPPSHRSSTRVSTR